jgi:Xaa-Pro aminopeptidase
MDVSEMGGYAATSPDYSCFGRSNEQQKVYIAVLRTRDSIVASIRPNACRTRPIARRVIDAKAGKFPYSVSHHLGIDVHDVGKMDTRRPMVITVEPGIYIPESDTTVALRFRGMGVRIEDDVLVTPSGHEVLSEAIPRAIREIEKAMRGRKRPYARYGAPLLFSFFA